MQSAFQSILLLATGDSEPQRPPSVPVLAPHSNPAAAVRGGHSRRGTACAIGRGREGHVAPGRRRPGRRTVLGREVGLAAAEADPVGRRPDEGRRRRGSSHLSANAAADRPQKKAAGTSRHPESAAETGEAAAAPQTGEAAALQTGQSTAPETCQTTAAPKASRDGLRLRGAARHRPDGADAEDAGAASDRRTVRGEGGAPPDLAEVGGRPVHELVLPVEGGEHVAPPPQLGRPPPLPAHDAAVAVADAAGAADRAVVAAVVPAIVAAVVTGVEPGVVPRDAAAASAASASAPLSPPPLVSVHLAAFDEVMPDVELLARCHLAMLSQILLVT